EEPAERAGILLRAGHLSHPPGMFPGKIWPEGHAELRAAGGQDAGPAGDPNRCVGVTPEAENGGPCSLAGPEGERKFFLERHGEARYHGCRVRRGLSQNNSLLRVLAQGSTS